MAALVQLSAILIANLRADVCYPMPTHSAY
jgi:hypothetical protein